MSDFPFALTAENVVTWKSLTEGEKSIRRILATALGGSRTTDAAATSGRDLHTTALYDGHGVYGYALALDGVRVPFLVASVPLGRIEDVILIHSSGSRCLTRWRRRPTKNRAALLAAVASFLRDRGLAA